MSGNGASSSLNTASLSSNAPALENRGKKKLKTYSPDEVVQLIKSLRAEVKALKRDKIEREEHLKVLKQQNEHFAELIATPSDHQRTVAALKKEISIKNESIAMLAKQNQALREANKAQGNKEDAEKRVAALCEEKVALLSKQNELQALVHALETSKGDQEHQVLLAQTAIQRAQRENKELSEDNTRLRRLASHLEEEKDALNESLEVLAQKVEELTLKVDATADYLSRKSHAAASRSSDDQQKLHEQVHRAFPELDADEVVLDWFVAGGGFVYVLAEHVLYDSPLHDSKDVLPIKNIASLNKTTSGGILPLPTVEIRLRNGDMKSYAGFVRRKTAISMIIQRAKALRVELKVYDYGRLMDAVEIEGLLS